MAGWTNPGSAAGRGGGGGGGRGFAGAGSTRWRERQRETRPQPPQPHYRYRPVNNNATNNANASSSSSTTLPPPPPPRLHGHGQPQGSSSSTSMQTQTQTQSQTQTQQPQANLVTSTSGKDDDRVSRNAANFECNVCFDMAADPVVTKCGHLFCWDCLYQWLHVHSNHRECPVCKGQVADDAIIPIYGRGGSAASPLDAAPPRPNGARVESSRQQQQQQRHALSPPAMDMEMEMHHFVYDDVDDDPFDLQEPQHFGTFGVSSLADTMINSFLHGGDEVVMQEYDDYTLDEVHDYDLLGFPVFASAAAASSQGPAAFNFMDAFLNSTSSMGAHHHYPPLRHPAANIQNRGRRQRRRARAAAASADHSSVDGMVMGGSSGNAFYRDAGGAGPNGTTDGSSRTYGSWTERRGRSNRISNSGGGRGMQDNRQHRNSTDGRS